MVMEGMSSIKVLPPNGCGLIDTAGMIIPAAGTFRGPMTYPRSNRGSARNRLKDDLTPNHG
jgi:hypothetical protein